MTEDIKTEAAATYGAAADHFDDPALSFWDRFGRRTVERIRLRPGERVLDACCGTGASALPAAEAVGPTGTVLGVDIAQPPINRARAKAATRGLANIEFRVGDIEATGLPSESFDAVICVFGIFFLPDMRKGVRELWRLLRPSGRLALTFWGPEFMEPATSAFWAAVGDERPDLVDVYRPWTRVTSPEKVEALLTRAGITGAEIVAEPGQHDIGWYEDWWTIVLGTGYRLTIEKLGPEAAQRVRSANLAALRRLGTLSLAANVIYAVAGKP